MKAAALRPDDIVDLQIHTVYSDGHWQPDQLFTYLRNAGFRLVAITDHDTCEHVEELRRLGAAQGIIVLPAMEVTTDWHGASAHLLCFAPEAFGSRLSALARGVVERQRQNTGDVYHELLRRGYAFPRLEDALGGLREPVRPADNEILLTAHGYVSHMTDAFALITDAGYRQMTVPLSDAVDAAHDAGAFTVIAHPGRGDGEIHRYEVDELSALLDDVPLDGVEIYYPKHTAEQVADFARLAARRGLLVSAGSDSHGPDQRLPIPYEAALVTGLLARCGVSVEP